ncbi:MAG: glycosyltransferase family 4 protein [Thaumarchaeota archaeon]|nr:glycosyltransferase family 4 protein [Nitrososphaerota archaeon]
MERSVSSTGKSPAKRFIVGTFIHTYAWGHQIRGDERGYIEKVKAFRSLGFEFYTLEKEPSIQDGMNEQLYTKMILGRCPIPPQSIGQLLMLSLFSLKAAIRRYPSRPVAIYAYNQDIENLWVGFLLKLLFGAPLIVVYHQIRPAAFVSFGKGIIDRTRRGFHPVRAVFKSLLPALNRFAANHADVHIALSEATREDVEKHIGIKDCTVVGNGLDTVKFRPLDLPKTFDAAFLGRLAPQKGIDVLLQAWNEVVQEEPGSQLVILGGGDPEDVLRYKGMAKELRLERNVEFRGFVEDAELVRLLNSSKIFVFPSRMEGFAQAVSQAMGCGLCCLLSDIPPLKEVYGGAAVFFPVDQPSALASKIRELLRAEEERKMFAKKARQLAENFSWENTVKRELVQLSRHSEAP